MGLGADDILSISIYAGAPSADDDGACVATVSAFGLAECDENVFTPTAPDDAAVEEARANARLIAAAPEMLEALQDAMRWFSKLDDWSGVGDPDIAKYEAAIAKATGGAA